jgi:glutamine amidotransferase
MENSALNNPHGFGFAIAVPNENRIIVEKSMDADESINRFLALRAIYTDGYAMWHARFATHGSRTLENCHPFAIGHDDRTYLGHNGILSIAIPEKDDRSDSKVYSEELIPRMCGDNALDDD